VKRVLEICANSVQSARAAQMGGAQRIELCQNLEQGGITPSYGLIQRVQEALSIPAFVLIRPRPGSFCYDADEQAIMLADITACRNLGCAGVVLGALDAAGQVDVACCQMLIAAAGSMQVTFHRAFDACADQALALETIIDLGCHRLLTSGGQPSAVAGQEQLARLIRQAAGRISIMPGAGIAPSNIRSLAEYTGATEFHTSAKRQVVSTAAAVPTEFDTTLPVSDATIVAELVAQLHF
jgi:copper homeostasis protein